MTVALDVLAYAYTKQKSVSFIHDAEPGQEKKNFMDMLTSGVLNMDR